MSAEKFIDHVAATGSVDKTILEKLRQKVAKSEKAVSIEKIRKEPPFPAAPARERSNHLFPPPAPVNENRPLPVVRPDKDH